MKKIYFLTMLAFLAFNAKSQDVSVTLKVIDNQNGQLTNKVDDNNETNVFCWAGNADGTIYDGDWWYPMYSGEAGRPGGELIKKDGKWIWQCTFHNVAPGNYQWNPHMKTLGWQPINTTFSYGEEADLHFSVESDGTIKGQTVLELPLKTTSIRNQPESDLNIYLENRSIYLENIPKSTLIRVYNMQGQLIKEVNPMNSKNSVQMPFPGVFLVKAGDQVRKVLIK